jgi:hypothetical protein
MIPLLLACAPSGPWTAERAVAPTLAVLDRDHDGRVVAGEYLRSAWAAPPFSSVDGDGDGVLAADELGVLIEGVDPLSLSGQGGGMPPMPGRPGGRGGPGMGPRPASGGGSSRSEASWALLCLAAEVSARDPEAELPTQAELASITSLASPEGRAALERIRTAAAKAGVPVPEGWGARPAVRARVVPGPAG